MRRTSGYSLQYKIFQLMPYGMPTTIDELATQIPGVSPRQIGKCLAALNLRYSAVESIERGLWKRVLKEYPRDVKIYGSNGTSTPEVADKLEQALDTLLKAADNLANLCKRTEPDADLKAENERLKIIIRTELKL